jgi:hypothetical protein
VNQERWPEIILKLLDLNVCSQKMICYYKKSAVMSRTSNHEHPISYLGKLHLFKSIGFKECPIVTEQNVAGQGLHACIVGVNMKILI